MYSAPIILFVTMAQIGQNDINRRGDRGGRGWKQRLPPVPSTQFHPRKVAIDTAGPHRTRWCRCCAESKNWEVPHSRIMRNLTWIGPAISPGIHRRHLIRANTPICAECNLIYAGA